MANVAFIRSELKALLDQYYLIRDCLLGETVIKKRRTTYLPIPGSDKTSEDALARYRDYLLRAVFYNVTRRTLGGLVGQVFMREPVIKLPEILKVIESDVTGTGISLVQQAKSSLAMTLAYSRSGLFVDYPIVEGSATIADLQTGKIRPTIYAYAPYEVINWRTATEGANQILTLVVLAELYEYADDGFEVMQAQQFRVLKLNDSGHYVMEIWRELAPTMSDGSKIKTGNYSLFETLEPRDYSGAPMREIPFRFIGSENNDVLPDSPNLYDLASLNLAHYRTSADYEEACFMVGQPTPVLTGLTEEWVAKVLKGVVAFGSRGGIPLPVGGDARLLEASSNTMQKENMDTKERQMVALGAKLVEQKQVQRTAFETKVEATSEGSVLSSTTKNVSDAYLWALGQCAELTGQPASSVKFELNTDFDIARMTPEEQKEIVDQWTKGALTFEEMRTGLRKAGIVTEEDAQAKTKIDTAMVDAMALAMPPNVPGDPSAQAKVGP